MNTILWIGQAVLAAAVDRAGANGCRRAAGCGYTGYRHQRGDGFELKEPGNVGTNLFLLGIALFVARGRFRQL